MPETLQTNRSLRRIGPVLNQSRLWHFSRKGIALGPALGIFLGALILVAKIPFAAALALAGERPHGGGEHAGHQSGDLWTGLLRHARLGQRGAR